MVEPSGSIVIDGIEVTKMGLTDLRNAISVIPQVCYVPSNRVLTRGPRHVQDIYIGEGTTINLATATHFMGIISVNLFYYF